MEIKHFKSIIVIICQQTTFYMKNIYTLALIALFILLFQSCKDESDNDRNSNHQQPTTFSPVPEFFLDNQLNQPEFITIADASHQIRTPQDLDFHPERESELWVLNKGNVNTGGNTVLLFNAGQNNQSHQLLKDGNTWHFLSMPTAMEFGENGNWGSSSGVIDANHSGGTFAGPTLWSGDLSIYAVVGNPPTKETNGSHLDMVHQSPYTMGIAHEVDNAYWLFDGYNGNLIRYDFKLPHVPGGHYHGDAQLFRHTDVKLKKSIDDLPSHMVLDKKSGWLYIAETENSRILRFNINSGDFARDLTPAHNEPLAKYAEYNNSQWEVFYDKDLSKPVGIEISENRLFVSDYETGEIIAFDTMGKEEIERIQTGSNGILGLAVDNNKRIWFVNELNNNVVLVNPN